MGQQEPEMTGAQWRALLIDAAKAALCSGAFFAVYLWILVSLK
jgi:hypothetical protein